MVTHWYNIGRISYRQYWQSPVRQYWTNISYMLAKIGQCNYDI